MNEEQCRGVLIELGSAFPKTKPLGTMEEQVTLWMRHFRHVDIEEMIPTVMRIVDREQFFPTIKEFARTLSSITDRPLDGAECMCDGIGYYEATKGQWIPCPGCLPETHRRWADGHFEPGHWCDECAKVAKGEGRRQEVDERRLVERPTGRKLSKEENLDRLQIVQEVVAEIAAVRKADPGRDKRLTPAEKQRFWEQRFNDKIAGTAKPLEAEPALLLLPDLAAAGDGLVWSNEPITLVDEDGIEIL